MQREKQIKRKHRIVKIFLKIMILLKLGCLALIYCNNQQ